MGLLPLIGTAVGALSGAINNNQKKAEFNRQKELAAKMEANSPWTGVHGQMPTSKPSLFGDIAGGALGGGMMGNNVAQAGGIGGWGAVDKTPPVTPTGGFTGSHTTPWSGMSSGTDFWSKNPYAK